VAILAASDKPNGVGLPKFRADADTTPAQNAVVVSKWIADLSHPATYGNVLNGPGVRGLRDEQLREVASQFPDFFRIAPNHHAFLYVQRAGSGNLRSAVLNVLHNA
jgi:hypothetical protein